MAKEKIVGFRVSGALHTKLQDMALEKNTSISEIVRQIVIDNVDVSYQYSQWETHAWNLFDVNADQVAYARRASKTPGHFFSIIAKWAKSTKIHIIAHPEMTMVEFLHQKKSYIVSESNVLPKMQVIQSVIDQLVEKIEAEVLHEEESLCNGTVGGDTTKPSEEQHDESGASVQESSGRKQYTDLPDPV